MSVDRATIEALYRSHAHIVLRRARMLLGSEADAQEALQEVFASLLKSPEAVLHPRSIVGWLYRATTHFCLNHLRNLRTGTRLLDARATAPAQVAAMNVEAMAEVRRVLALLAADVAAAVVYHHLDGMTHAEIAELLGCSRRQVGYLLERARHSIARAERIA